eukprot:1157308-Pelagomonas_calceolata.AAC.17
MRNASSTKEGRMQRHFGNHTVTGALSCLDEAEGRICQAREGPQPSTETVHKTTAMLKQDRIQAWQQSI